MNEWGSVKGGREKEVEERERKLEVCAAAAAFCKLIYSQKVAKEFAIKTKLKRAKWCLKAPDK